MRRRNDIVDLTFCLQTDLQNLAMEYFNFCFACLFTYLSLTGYFPLRHYPFSTNAANFTLLFLLSSLFPYALPACLRHKAICYEA